MKKSQLNYRVWLLMWHDVLYYSETSRDTTPHDTGLALTSSEDMLNKPSLEEQLLLIVSNCNYTERHVAPELFECFVNHGYPECEAVAEVASQQ